MGRVRRMDYILVTFMVVITTVVGQRPRIDFYRETCPIAESLVRSIVERHLIIDPQLSVHILQMHLKDCFVRGCDGSILIAGAYSERTATPNQSLKGFEVIEEAKARLEASCPNTVFCADILALPARDVIFFSSRSAGGVPSAWGVPLGRLDGRVSLASEVNVPDLSDHVLILKEKFRGKGLNYVDLVTLGQATIMQRFGRLNLQQLIRQPEFTSSMIKMSMIEVKTNPNEGEIRRVCSTVN